MSAEHVQAAIAALDTMADDDREPERYRTDFRAAAEHFRSLLAPTPWRFDVPEVPDSVTAIKDSAGDVWLREQAGGYDEWVRVDEPEPGLGSRSIAELLELAPLVECEDPRGTG